MWKSAPIARWRMSSKWPLPKPNSSLTVRSPSFGNSALISGTSLSCVNVNVAPVATLTRKARPVEHVLLGRLGRLGVRAGHAVEELQVPEVAPSRQRVELAALAVAEVRVPHQAGAVIGDPPACRTAGPRDRPPRPRRAGTAPAPPSRRPG